MLMTSNPLSLYFSWMLLMLGISARHGGHQVAQKSTSTTLPRKSLSSNFRFEIGSTASKFGNGLPRYWPPGAGDESTHTARAQIANDFRRMLNSLEVRLTIDAADRHPLSIARIPG